MQAHRSWIALLMMVLLLPRAEATSWEQVIGDCYAGIFRLQKLEDSGSSLPDAVDFSSATKISVVAYGGDMRRVTLSIFGPENNSVVKNFLPYTMSGVNLGTPGMYTLTAKTYAGYNATGESCAEKTITFTIQGDVLRPENCPLISAWDSAACDGNVG